MAAALRWLLGIDSATDKWDPQQFTVKRKTPPAVPSVGLAEAPPQAAPPPGLCSTFHYRNPSGQDPMRVDQPPLKCQQSAWLEEEATHFPTGTGIRANQLEPGLYDETRHNSFRAERRVYKGRKQDRFTGKMVDLYEDDPPPPNGDFQTFGGKHAMRRLQGDDLSQAPYEGLKRQETTFDDEPLPDLHVDQDLAGRRHEVMERQYRDVVFNQDGKTPFDESYRKQDAYPVGYIGRQNMVRHTPVLPPTAREALAGSIACSGMTGNTTQSMPVAQAEHRLSTKPSLALGKGTRNAGSSVSVETKRDADVRLPTAEQLRVPTVTHGRANADATSSRATTTHIMREERQLPTQSGHQLVPRSGTAPVNSTHKDSTLNGGAPRLTAGAAEGPGVPSQVAHLDGKNMPLPEVALLQMEGSQAHSHRSAAMLPHKEQAAAPATTIQVTAHDVARTAETTQNHDSTQDGQYMVQNFPHQASDTAPEVSRTGRDSQPAATGTAHFPGGLPVSEKSHHLRPESTYSPLVTVWQGPQNTASVEPSVRAADHEQAMTRHASAHAQHTTATVPAAVQAADREMTAQHQGAAQQEGLGGRAPGTSDHREREALPSPAAGQPCHATSGDTRSSTTERNGHDAVPLGQAAQLGGLHANESHAAQPAVQCTDGEMDAVQTAGHGCLQAAQVPGRTTSELASEYTNTRDTFGVGDGTSAHQERLTGQCTLAQRETAVQRTSQPSAQGDSTVLRSVPAVTERPTELALPQQTAVESA